MAAANSNAITSSMSLCNVTQMGFLGAYGVTMARLVVRRYAASSAAVAAAPTAAFCIRWRSHVVTGQAARRL